MQRFVRWFALLWAAGAYVVLLRLPTYGWVRDTTGADGSSLRATGSATLAAVNGPRVYVIMAVPVLAAVLAVLPWPIRLRRTATVAGAAVAVGFVIIGILSVGPFFLPAAVALAVAALAPRPA